MYLRTMDGRGGGGQSHCLGNVEYWECATRCKSMTRIIVDGSLCKMRTASLCVVLPWHKSAGFSVSTAGPSDVVTLCTSGTGRAEEGELWPEVENLSLGRSSP